MTTGAPAWGFLPPDHRWTARSQGHRKQGLLQGHGGSLLSVMVWMLNVSHKAIKVTACDTTGRWGPVEGSQVACL